MDEGRPASNPMSNTWTVARSASTRQHVEWVFDDGLPKLKFQDLVLKSSSRRKILYSIRNRLRQDRALVLLSKPHQGKVMEVVAQSPASSHFYYNGEYTRFSDWRFIFKARAGLLPLNGAPWKEGDKGCRRCSKADLETLAHVLNHCEGRSRCWQLRHDGIQNRVVHTAQHSAAQILSINKQVPGTNLRPDIIMKIDDVIHIIDITCPFENRIDGFEKAKHDRYAPLLEQFASQASRVEINPILVGAIGAWDPANDKFLLKIASRNYLKKMQKLCISDNIRWARDIYVEHVTGRRQFDEAEILRNPNFRPCEPVLDDPLDVPQCSTSATAMPV
ncbi:hypothetical protein AVEN_269516-1 [Araneus ventricosus]|uniref:Reverse transcriptase n=1 Tax=Araneus ventricosus TaxID=182803 RepID=A0A4Y1ZRY9_ARAVE|nr:hypothetical protein AVEN_269516-1 [Araneus ventricosus]